MTRRETSGRVKGWKSCGVANPAEPYSLSYASCCPWLKWNHGRHETHGRRNQHSISIAPLHLYHSSTPPLFLFRVVRVFRGPLLFAEGR